FSILAEALNHYPADCAFVHGIEFQSAEFAYDPQAIQLFLQPGGVGVDPRGLTAADSSIAQAWRDWRVDNLKVFTSSLSRRLQSKFPNVALAAFVEPTAVRESHLQDWP